MARRPRGTTLGWLAMFGGLLALPAVVSDPYHLHVLIMAEIYGILALSLNLIYLTGLLSIAHAAFMAVGAYASALLTVRAGLSSWLALPAGVAIAVVLSLVLGALTLRMRGIYFIMMTFAFGEVVRLVMASWESVLGGHTGISGITPLTPVPLPGVGPLRFATKPAYYYLVLSGLAAAAAVTARIADSRTGRAMEAIRIAPQLAECVGIDPRRYKLLAFAIGSAFAAAAGSLYAHYAYYVSPELASFWASVDLIVMLMVGGGGVSPVAGPIAGAFFMTVLPEALRASKQYQHILAACALILVVRFFPGGLVGLVRDAAGRVWPRRPAETPGA